uniref:RRM domain-containing protein n=1 Tax=Bionectria ochroleuca TaxID=29856 RepID=A0A8H7K7I0_BIOOC
MKQYFSQFGTVTQIRLSRNKKTGASKHFAFIEFAEASTAEIVAKTMDNYLLFGHILKCKVLPKEQAHDDIFKGANKRFKKVPWNKIAGKNLEKPLSESSWKKKVTKEQNKRNKSAEVLKKIGYTFEAPAIQAIPPLRLSLRTPRARPLRLRQRRRPRHLPQRRLLRTPQKRRSPSRYLLPRPGSPSRRQRRQQKERRLRHEARPVR